MGLFRFAGLPPWRPRRFVGQCPGRPRGPEGPNSVPCEVWLFLFWWQPPRGLRGPCRPKSGTGGLSDQLRRIRQSKFPSYKAGVKGLVLGPHVGLSLVERRTLADALLAGGPGAQEDSQSQRLGFQCGFACREQVLDSFGLEEADLAWVRARGEEFSRPSRSLEEESDSDASDFV